MSKYLLYICVLTVVLLTSCYRDDLCYLHPEGARIRLVVQYDPKLQPDKSYVAIYNADNGQFVREELMKTPLYHDLSLEVGRYNIVVYNEPIVEGEYTTAHTVDFANIETWPTWKAFAVGESTPPNGYSGRMVVPIQDQLAVDRMFQFEVTPGMLSLNHVHPAPIEDANTVLPIDTTLRFFPKRVFTKVNMEVEVTHYVGWTLRRSNGNRPRFTGAAESYYIGPHNYAPEYTAQYVEFANGGTYFDESAPKTRFTSTYYMAGLQNDEYPTRENSRLYTLFLRFEHGSSTSPTGVEIRPVTADLVTGEGVDRVSMKHTRVGETRQVDGTICYNDVLDIKVELTLPERVPIGEDADVDIDEWEDQDVPLDTPPKLYFHPNQGTGDIFSWRYPVGKQLFMPAPTSFTAPEKRKFKEWNTKNDGTGQSLQPGDLYPMPTGGGTLYAIWEKIE